jgi:hypothetical protein
VIRVDQQGSILITLLVLFLGFYCGSRHNEQGEVRRGRGVGRVRRLGPLDGQMMRESTQGPQDTFLRADPDANRPSLPLVT